MIFYNDLYANEMWFQKNSVMCDAAYATLSILHDRFKDMNWLPWLDPIRLFVGFASFLFSIYFF